MSFELKKVLQSKRAFRQRQAARPIEEKLALLDVLRDRALAIRGQTTPLRGILKRNPDAKSLSVEMAEHKREEKELEDKAGSGPGAR